MYYGQNVLYNSRKKKYRDVILCPLQMDEEGGFLLRNMKSSLAATRLDDLTADWIIFKCSAVRK